MGRTDLSFVIPAYNEEDSIEAALITLDDVVKNKELHYEIVVVDDGSRDETFSKAMAYAKRNGHVKVIRCNKNVGKGQAVKTGFMRATGEVVVFADGDMELDLSTIPSYVDALEHGDIVIATKWHPNSVVDMPLIRRILSHGFNMFVRILTGAKIRDTQVGLKVMKKSAFMKIFPRLCVKRYAFDVELLAVASLYGLTIVEMPVQLRLRGLFRVSDVFRMFLDLLGIAYRLRVTHWYERPIVTQNEHSNFLSIEVGGY